MKFSYFEDPFDAKSNELREIREGEFAYGELDGFGRKIDNYQQINSLGFFSDGILHGKGI